MSRVWFAMDVGFLSDPTVIEIGEDHGPAGVAILVAVFSACKAQETTRDPGTVTHSWRALARTAFLHGQNGADKAREIIEQAATAGMVEIVSDDGRAFELRLAKWSSYQQTSRQAIRQKEYRDRKRGITDHNADVTRDNAASPRGDGPSPTRTRTRTEEKKTSSSSPDDSPDPPENRRVVVDDETAAQVEKLCETLAGLIEDTGSPRPRVTEKWRSEARLMLTREKRSAEQIERVMRWCKEPSCFWCPNIQSMPKFRQKFDTLRLQMERDSGVVPLRRGSVFDAIDAIPDEGEAA